MLSKDSPKYIQINNAVEYFKNNKISITACSKMFGIHRETLAKYLKEYDLHEDRRSYKIYENFFKVIDTEEKAYWLGFITADGGLKSDVNVLKLRQSKKDTSHLEKFNKSICSERPISYETVTIKGKSYETANVIIQNKEIYNDLLKLDLKPNKSCTEVFANISQDLLPHYIRGLYDGDGWLSWGKGWCEIGIGMGEDILLSLKDVVEREANIKPYKVLPFKSIFRYRITSKGEAIKLLNYMYENATIYLDRKYENYLKFAVLSQKSQKA